MDIVFIVDSLIRGGAETQLTRIAGTLRERGWHVGIIAMFPPNGFRKELDLHGIPCVQCVDMHGRSPHLVAWRMIAQLRAWRPTAVATFNFYGDLGGRIAARLARVPLVFSSQRTAHFKTGWRKLLYRITEPLVDLTISNSQAALDLMLAEGILSRNKTALIPNGILSRDFLHPLAKGEARAELALPPDTFLWVAVGSLTPPKDYPTLLRAVAACATSGRAFKVLIAGGGRLLQECQDLAEALGIRGQITFLGERSPEEVRRLLRAGDALVLSSAWEGMPNAVMEGMAAGLPVLATGVGGVGELLEPGRSGLIVPPGDPGALAEGMRTFMASDPARLAEMGAIGRSRIEHCHDQEKITDQWAEALSSHALRRKRLLPGPGPSLVISLDLELHWGVRDKRSLADYGDSLMGVREAVPAMLALFRKYGVRATWATVGMLLFEKKSELLQYLPEIRPTYTDTRLDPYRDLEQLGADEREDPFHYGLSLVRQILESPDMELASHSFSHYYCMEAGQTPDQFRTDLLASVAASERLGQRPISLIFPRNQYREDYLELCHGAGFRVFRGNEAHPLYRSARTGDCSALQRGARLLDHYLNLSGHHTFQPWPEQHMVNCPASRFLRPYARAAAPADGLRVGRMCRSMERAARSGTCFHLWWHPHNFGADLPQNLAILEALLKHFARLRERYGMASRTMGEFTAFT